MLFPRLQLLLSPVRGLGGLLRSRPGLAVLAGLCALLLPAWPVARHYWFQSDLREARRAFDLDLLADAGRHIERYLTRCPDDLEGHFLAARIDRLRTRFPEAHLHLEECKRLDGVTERFQLELLLMRAQGGELMAVEPGLLYCVEQKHSARLLILETLSLSYLKELRYVASLACLDKWLKEEPDSVRALSWRGWVMENLHSKEDSRKDFERALELSPKHGMTRLRLINSLLADKDVRLATQHVDILEKAEPENPGVIYALAQCRALQGRSEEARELLDKLLALQPENSPALHRRGRLASDLHEQEKWFRKALAIDPSFAEARYGLYTCLQQQRNRNAEAAAELKTYEETVNNWEALRKTLDALERSPHNPDLLAKIGDLLMARDPTVGQQFLFKALAVAPDHALARQVLARHNQARKAREKNRTAPQKGA
jgi:tetratricopeptide (TPR) repeat protein